MNDFSGLWFDCEDRHTTTSEEQCACERECASFLKPFSTYSEETITKLQDSELINYNKEIRLLRAAHALYLTGGLVQLPYGFVSLDGSRPWICYWIIHALYLLDREPKYLYPRVISTLKHIQNRTGGFGGGPSQITQCAPNYAAVLTLCTIGTPEALDTINRPAMYSFFMSMKHSSGGLSIHEDGEVDTRGTYTIIAVARVLNILTDELKAGVADFILRCQTYEGGFGGEPFNEAHGGYNFCALATLLILGEAHRCDIFSQESWLLRRQMRLEGGFQGRTNKLVDSCYSFWQGAALAIVEIIRNGGSDVYDMEQYLAHCGARATTGAEKGGGGGGGGVKDNSAGSVGAQTLTGATTSAIPEKIDPVTGEIDDVEMILEVEEARRIKRADDTGGCLSYNQQALQRYILHCAQNLEGGGLRDKPGKRRDFYHSCYALSGLSISQNCITAPLHSDLLAQNSAAVASGATSASSVTSSTIPTTTTTTTTAAVGDASAGSNSVNGEAGRSVEEILRSELPEVELDWSGAQVYGDLDNLLEPTSAVFNIGLRKLDNALRYFGSMPCTHSELMHAFQQQQQQQQQHN